MFSCVGYDPVWQVMLYSCDWLPVNAIKSFRDLSTANVTDCFQGLLKKILTCQRVLKAGTKNGNNLQPVMINQQLIKRRFSTEID